MGVSTSWKTVPIPSWGQSMSNGDGVRVPGAEGAVGVERIQGLNSQAV